MRVELYHYRKTNGWFRPFDVTLDSDNTLILLFADARYGVESEMFRELAEAFPLATIVGCSTAGEIYNNEIYLESAVAVVVRLQKSRFRAVCETVENREDSCHAGRRLVENLFADDLAHVIVLSDGLHVNGSRLAEGIDDTLRTLGRRVPVIGGLAGDGERFGSTWVQFGRQRRDRCVVGVGFYGGAFRAECGSKGGWDRFGIERVVTRSEGNELFELDGKPALDIYKKYLGDHARDLPVSGLLFPLLIRDEKGEKVRTILSVDEEKRSITFAGDIPQGVATMFMKSNYNNLINGAEGAGMQIDQTQYHGEEALLLAISCMGRRLVLGQWAEEEVDVLRALFPPTVRLAGFYAYGEISSSEGACDLYNQTMSVAMMWESDDGC
jgi:hypothetical protein